MPRLGLWQKVNQQTESKANYTMHHIHYTAADQNTKRIHQMKLNYLLLRGKASIKTTIQPYSAGWRYRPGLELTVPVPSGPPPFAPSASPS